MKRWNRPAKRGDRFESGGDLVEVTRASRTGPWVDIRVTQPSGATWTKRMPHGIPADWRRLS